MNRNQYIYLSGPSEAKIQAAVQALANLYAETEFVKEIAVFKAKTKNDYILNFKNPPDLERFKYFVNYLHYPEIDNFNSKVIGYWIISETDNLTPHLNQRAMLYVSDRDTEGDNVYALFTGTIYPVKLGFSRREAYQPLNADHKEFEFHEPALGASDFTLIATISPEVTLKKSPNLGCLPMVAILLASGGYVTFQVLRILGLM